MRPENVKRIALAVPLEWEYAHRLIEGVLAFQAERGGYALRDFRFSDPHFVRPDGPPTWGGWRPCGIVCAVGSEPGLAEWLISGGLPLVNTAADVPQDLIPSVHCTGAGKLAVEHFVSLGYRNIAHVGLRALRGSELGCQNAIKAITAAGCNPFCYQLHSDPMGATDARFKEVASEPGLIEFLKTAPKPLAVLAINDDFARCVCIACHSLGLAIPEDVAVLGADDTSVARLNVPPLSSIRTPGERVGYQAMQLLDHLIDGGRPPDEPILIPCESIAVRQSTQKSEDTSVDRAVRLIEAEACRGLTVGDLVRYLVVSRSSFEKRFTEQVGRAPGQEIQRVKLARAKKLLADSELSITRIAGMVGFARSSIFGEFFKRQTGMTPTAYRIAAPNSKG